MRLTNVYIKSLKPKEKAYKIFDGHGLYLEVTPAGSKIFRYAFRFNGGMKTLTIGWYPTVGLAEARDLHYEFRKKMREEKRRRKVESLTSSTGPAITKQEGEQNSDA